MTLSKYAQITKGIKKRSVNFNAGDTAFAVLGVFCFILIMKNSSAAIEYMGRGLSLCASTVIPSLFPFMVISELLVKSGVGNALGKFLAPVMKRVFNLSGAGCSAAFLGSLCGFPIGAKTAISLYDSGDISKSEAEHLMTFSNNPSTAFLINAAGITLLGNKSLGVLIYFCVLGSGFIAGFLTRFFIRSDSKPKSSEHKKRRRISGVEVFTTSVSGAAGGMLTVCAYVIFFSALTGALADMLSAFSDIPDWTRALIFGFFEISSGISRAAEISHPFTAAILCSLIAGWSGLSVHFQIISIGSGRGISFKPYIISKFFQGLLAAILTAIFLIIFPKTLQCGSLYEDAFAFDFFRKLPTSEVFAFSVKSLFLCGMIGYFIKRKSSRFLS